jgi:hypothetical protein
VLSQYFAAMYPRKVGRLVIDGVVDVNNYYTGEWYLDLDNTDAVLLSFFKFCHQAGLSKCPLYGLTVPNIQKRVDTHTICIQGSSRDNKKIAPPAHVCSTLWPNSDVPHASQ